MNGDEMNQHNSPSNQNWQFESMSLPNSSIPDFQSIDMSSNNLSMPPRLDMGSFLPTNVGTLPPSLSDFPIDSSFIERAAKFSSFNTGNFSALVNPFGSLKSEAVKDCSMNVDGSRRESSMNRHVENGYGAEEMLDGNNVSGDSCSRGINAKKRKSNSQDMELDQVQDGQHFSSEIPKEYSESKQNVECSSSTPTSGKKSTAKNSKVNTDEAKQDYIHVRARRGQATNSHSLAERVRRERISERMKYLQDLVPGCSKVTGKAVMLDEIINYVQSLQRQVEFLSMKLSTVNPSIDLNIERLLSKDILQHQIGPSTLGFSPDMIHPQFIQSQHSLMQNEMPGMLNNSDPLRRAVNSQFTALNLLKGPTPQLPNPWDTELQNMLQMNFNTNTQELNGKPNNSTFQH